jgi:alcohol dehydrogenase (NADP+)
VLTRSKTWNGTKYPIVVGHEIVGKAVKVGSKVKDIKVGDTVGVGAQIGSCGECKHCKNGDESALYSR